ncbi:hypothetical protein PFISCL1PPCAC_11702, partial [Pristionchus fissidentatus]
HFSHSHSVDARALMAIEYTNPKAIMLPDPLAVSRKKLRPGQIISSEIKNYRIEGSISERIGHVFMVRQIDCKDNYYAMKMKYTEDDKLKTMKHEMYVYQNISKASADIDTSRFLQFIDRGRTPDFKYIMLELVANTISDIQAERSTPFSLATVAHVARE